MCYAFAARNVRVQQIALHGVSRDSRSDVFPAPNPKASVPPGISVVPLSESFMACPAALLPY